MSGVAKELWGGLDRADLERIRVDAALDELGYRSALLELHAALPGVFDRLLDEAMFNVAGALVAVLVAWCGILELPDPSRCPICGERRNEIRTWASYDVVGYTCSNWHDGDLLPGMPT